MDKKYILLILTIIVLICVVIGLAIELQGTKQVKPAVNNTTNNAPVNTTVEHINKDEQSSPPTKTVVAYKSDGTPMYSQYEVSMYVKSKYGAVDYHIQSNGYIAIDDPHYTSDGRRIR